jgi:hypothetical protein
VVLQNLAAEVGGLATLTSATAFVLGIFFVVASLLLAYRSANPASRADHRSMAWFWSLVIGAAMLALPTTIASVAVSMFGSGTTTDLTFAYTTGPTAGKLAPLVPILKLIGVIAVMRGLVVMRTVGMYGNYSRGNATFHRGLVLIIAGVLLVHMQNTLQIASKLTGLNLGASLF